MVQNPSAPNPSEWSRAMTNRWRHDIRQLTRKAWPQPYAASDSLPRFYASDELFTPQYLNLLCIYFARGALLTLALALGASLISFVGLQALEFFQFTQVPLLLSPLLAPTLLFLSWHVIHRLEMFSAQRHLPQVRTSGVLLEALHQAAPELASGECARLTERLMHAQPDGGLPLVRFGQCEEYFAPIVYSIEQRDGQYELVRSTPGAVATGGATVERWPLVF
jgi:hypothetical protein